MKILMQTTIASNEDNWCIHRFSELRRELESIDGVEVTARDRAAAGGDDPVLSSLADSDYDQLWLFAVDQGDGLTVADCLGINSFVQQGGGLLATRDHSDMGSSLLSLDGVGGAHFFHTRHPDPDQTRQQADNATTPIPWPNYQSGPNGNYQRIEIEGELHPLLRRKDGTAIEWFPSHPHEGAVACSSEQGRGRVIAKGRSQATHRTFNLIVVFDSGGKRRAVAESSIHHFADYNWNPRLGCPSFVEEQPGDEVIRDPQRLDDVKQYVRNVAAWLGTRQAR